MTAIARSTYQAMEQHGIHFQSAKFGDHKGWKPFRIVPVSGVWSEMWCRAAWRRGAAVVVARGLVAALTLVDSVARAGCQRGE